MHSSDRWEGKLLPCTGQKPGRLGTISSSAMVIRMLPCRLGSLHCGGLIWKFHTLGSDKETRLWFFRHWAVRCCRQLGPWELGSRGGWAHSGGWLRSRPPANNLWWVFSTCSYLIQGFLKGSYVTASLWWPTIYKATLASFVQHFRINCVCTAKPENLTLISLCFLKNLPGSCLQVGVLLTFLSSQIQKAVLEWTSTDTFCFQGDV